MDVSERIGEILSARRERRELRHLPDALPGVDFTSNDYLGLSRSAWIHHRVLNSLSLPAPLGATGSRLLSGNTPFVQALEVKLAQFLEAESALFFNSGYAANTGLIGTLCRPGDLVLYDRHVHASMHEGMKLSGAECMAFGHNDADHLESLLAANPGRTAFVLVETLYSMDGDKAPLRAIVDLKDRFDFNLIADEAHALGVFGRQGRGLCDETGVAGACLARVYTFGKALGAHGAAVAGPAYLRDYLINFCKPFIYSTAPDRAVIHAVDHGIDYLLMFNYQQIKLVNLMERFKGLIASGQRGVWVGEGPVFGLVAGDAARCRKLAQGLNEAGFDVRPIVYPTVARGGERIRVSLHSFNTAAEIDRFFAVLETLNA